MPLAVPQLQDPRHPTLQAHNDPLTLDDVSNTAIYVHETLQNALDHPYEKAAREDLARASKHMATVVTTHNAQDLQPPPWFQAQLEAALEGALGPIKADMADIKVDVATLKTDVATLKTDVVSLKTGLDKFKTRLAEVDRRTAIDHNRRCGEGIAIPFWVVTTANGENPQEKEPPLPALLKQQDILDLETAQLNEYLDAYGLSRTGTIAVRRQALGEYIGCTALFY